MLYYIISLKHESAVFPGALHGRIEFIICVRPVRAVEDTQSGGIMNKLPKKPRNENMYKAILSLNTVEECMKFFDDLCTVSELMAMEQRYQVASCLDDGMIYNEILAETGASSATISRVNRSLQYGSGGYAIVMSRLKSKENEQ